MSTFQSTKRFCALEHCLVTYRAVPLQPLWNAVMVIFHGDTCITTHAVAIINTQTFARSTHIAERTVVNVFVCRVVIEITNVACVSSKGLASRLTFRVDTFITCGLKSTAPHTQDFLDFISIQRRVFLFCCHFTSLITAESACVKPARGRMTNFT